MALKKRTVIDRVEILRDGTIQVRQSKEIYDSLIAPKPAKLAVFEEQIVPAITAVVDDDGNEISPAIEETTQQVEISPYEPAISDVESETYHRFVIAASDTTPPDIQAFIDASKGV